MTKDILRVFSALCSFFPVQARWPSWTSICRQWLMSPLVDLTLLREWCCFQCTSKKLGTVGLGLKWFFPLFHLEKLSKLYALSEALAISGYMVYDDVQYISGQTTQCVAPGVPAQRALGLGQWPLVRCEWGTELAQGLAGNLGILSGSTSKILKDVDILWQFSQTRFHPTWKVPVCCGHAQAICEKRKVAGICDTGWKAHEDSCYFKCLGAKDLQQLRWHGAGALWRGLDTTR